MNNFNPSVFSDLAHGLQDYITFYNHCVADYADKFSFKFNASALYSIYYLRTQLTNEVKKIVAVPGVKLYNKTHIFFNFEVSKIYFDLVKKCDIILSSLNKTR